MQLLRRLLGVAALVAGSAAAACTFTFDTSNLDRRGSSGSRAFSATYTSDCGSNLSFSYSDPLQSNNDPLVVSVTGSSFSGTLPGFEGPERSVTLAVSSSSGASATLTYRVGGYCVITITSPSTASQSFSSSTPRLQGTTAKYCNVGLQVRNTDTSATPISVTSVSVVNDSGNTQVWYYDPPSGLSDGNYQLTVTASPQQGFTATTASAAQTFQVRTPQTCSTPTIAAPAAGGTVSARRPTYSGTTSTTCNQIRLNFVPSISSNPIMATVDSTGRWTWTPSTDQPEGDYRLDVTASGPSNYATTNSGTISFTLRYECAKPTISYPAQGTTVNTHYPVIQGTYDPLCPTITLQGGGLTLYPTPVSGSPGTWSVTPSGSGYPDGIVSIYVSSSGTNRPAVTSVNTQFTVAADACSAPTLSAPSGQVAYGTNTPTFTGTIDTRCPSVAITYTRASAGSATFTRTISTSTFSIVSPNALPDGSYTATICTTSTNGRPGNCGSQSIAFTISASACPAPTISAGNPVNPTYYSYQSYNYNIGSDAGCRTIYVYVDNALVRTVPYDPSGTGSLNVLVSTTNLADGPHTVSFRASGPLSGSGRAQGPLSAGASFTLAAQACALPAVSSPGDGATVRTALPTISGSDPNGGLVQCIQKLRLTIQGQSIDITNFRDTPFTRATTRYWSYTFSSPLPDNTYQYTVQPYQQQDGGTFTAVGTPVQRSFTVNTTPVSTANPPRRKRSMCARDEVRCPLTLPNGFLSYECLPDLDTNAERCGACDGPDCTTIPNASEVQCVDGTCEVLACAEGFAVSGSDACVPVSALVFEEAW